MRILLLTAAAALCAAGQTPSDPPALIQIIRKAGSDTRLAGQYPKVQAQLMVFAMTSIAGTPETWLLETHDSFSSIEALDQALAGERRDELDAMDGPARFNEEVVAPPRTLIALYRANWSYKSAEAIKMLPKARYFAASMFTIRPGTEADLLPALRQRRGQFEAHAIEQPELAYQVISGEAEVLLFLAPLTSLKSLDEALTKGVGSWGKAGGDEIRREHFILRVEPKLSWVSDEFAEADQEFWRGRPKLQE